MAMKATAAQIGKVQVVYAQMAKREIGMENTREARLAWASQLLQRPVTTFSDLKRGEAIHLIDQAQGVLGVTYKPHTLPATREQARRAGLDGRKDVDHEFTTAPQLVAAQEIEQIQSFVHRLGWSQAQFEAWLGSKRSPFGTRSDKRIRTSADANQVRWALKRMLVRQGKWEEAA
jgi:hypothetical protein